MVGLGLLWAEILEMGIVSHDYIFRIDDKSYQKVETHRSASE